MAKDTDTSKAPVVPEKLIDDVENDIYGVIPCIQSTFQTKRQWTRVSALNESMKDQAVWVRARIQESRCKGKLGFLVLREQFSTVQLVLAAQGDEGKIFVKWTGSLPLESIVDVYGVVSVPPKPISGATQPVELQAQRIHCVSKAASELPFQLKDANRPEDEEGSSSAITVGQEIRLDNRILDLRTLAMQGVLRVSSSVCTLFREALLEEGFIEIHTPKLTAGSSEGGANVFKLKYFGRDACLAQSPQLYKQMAISSDLDRVFEIAPVFRAENSNTHRHMCEFTGLDLEMAFKEHYFEVLQVVEKVFKYIFAGLEKRCQPEIAAVNRQWPSQPFKWSEKVLRLDFEEGVNMLREAKIEGIPDDLRTFDLSTTQEKALGELVRQKYDTDFYYMINYPQGVRPFYTMPNREKPGYSNSFDIFMRGEEIVSGAQRIHEPEFLTERAAACGLDVSTIKDYIDAFRLGAYPHAGVGVGLERVVMLFLGLNNIRKSSMFPRDPKRLTP